MGDIKIASNIRQSIAREGFNLGFERARFLHEQQSWTDSIDQILDHWSAKGDLYLHKKLDPTYSGGTFVRAPWEGNSDVESSVAERNEYAIKLTNFVADVLNNEYDKNFDFAPPEFTDFKSLTDVFEELAISHGFRRGAEFFHYEEFTEVRAHIAPVEYPDRFTLYSIRYEYRPYNEYKFVSAPRVCLEMGHYLYPDIHSKSIGRSKQHGDKLIYLGLWIGLRFAKLLAEQLELQFQD